MPFSGFSLAMKRLKTAISLGARGRQLRCLAISSAMPGEGKTTIAANLATLFAASGVRTLLVDGDVRRATLSRVLAPQAELGLVEAMHGTAALADCVVRVEDLGFDLLPISGTISPQRRRTPRRSGRPSCCSRTCRRPTTSSSSKCRH